MRRKILRRIVAWIGILAAVAFAVFFVLNFYKFGETADRILGSFLWISVSLTIISFGVLKFFLPDITVGLDGDTLGDVRQADGGEDDIDGGEDDIPNSEGNEEREDKDNGGSN